MEILKAELAVLNCLIHPESFATVMEETKLPEKVALDILRSLVHFRYVKLSTSKGEKISMFSPDQLSQIRFQLTAKGFTVVAQNLA